MSDAATEVMIDALGEIEVGARPVVVDEETGRLVTALAASGHEATQWSRRVCDAGAVAAWPPAGSYSSALIRLPKSKDALDFALHASASVVSSGASLIVFGANDEGIRSAWPHLEAVADDVITVVTRRHCRVLMGKRRAQIINHRATLAAWRVNGEITIPGKTRPWVSYPGVFAKGTLDTGTALLLKHLPDLSDFSALPRVLDFAAGTGVIAAAIQERAPSAAIDLIEIDTLALAAARENLATVANTDPYGSVLPPAIRFIAGRSLGDARGPYDLILSNPPIHDGVREHHGVLNALITNAPEHLAPRGELRIVVQRRVNARTLIEAAFGRCDTIAETGQFRVLSGRRR